MPDRLNTNIFIERAMKKHGDRFDYSKVVYVNEHSNVTIICPIHGEFQQISSAHMSGDGCAFCSGKRNTTATFIEKAQKAHGNRYDYSNAVYKTAKVPVSIICRAHGVFDQLPGNHLSGHGCSKCRADELSGRFRMPIKDILTRCRGVHGDLYEYDIKKQPNNNSEKIKIICKIHGSFFQKINTHLLGSGCPKCCMSRGEIEVAQYLDKFSISYEHRKTFSSCKSINELPFDFYLPDYNACIEFDGEQHFRPYYKDKDKSIEKLRAAQKRDKIKDRWSIETGIPLLRVDTISAVKEDLSEFIGQLKDGSIIKGQICDKRQRGRDLLVLIDRYEKGASLGYLALNFPYARSVIREILLAHGIIIRTRSEQRLWDFKDHPYKEDKKNNSEVKLNIHKKKDPVKISIPAKSVTVHKEVNTQHSYWAAARVKKSQKVFERCSIENCLARPSGRFCSTHWSQYYRGIIDIDGKKLRELRTNRKYFDCLAKEAGTGECSTKMMGRFCTKHRNQYYQGIIDKDGNKLRDLKKWRIKYPDCLAKNAGTGICRGRKYGRFCQLHHDHYRTGIIDKDGNKLRDLTYGLKYHECIAKNSGTGCCHGKKVGRFCRKHYAQFEHGIIDTNGNVLRIFKKRGRKKW